MEKRFTCSMDRSTNVMTWSVAALFLLILFLNPNYYVQASVLLLFIVTYMTVYGNLPTRIRLNEKVLILDAPFRKRFIPLAEIEAIRSLTKADQKGLIRTCGSSGIFGHWGYYYSSNLGKVKIYVRQNNNWVMITTRSKGQYIIATDDPDFFEALKAELIIERR